MDFKADLQHVAIRAQKDPEKKWHDLPYLEMNDAVDAFLDRWLTKWRTASNLGVGSSKFAMQHKKEEVKLKMA